MRSARCRREACPTRSSRAREEPLRSLLARFARGRGPFTTREADERFGLDAEPRKRAGHTGAWGAARPRRAPSRRNRARVVRSRCPPPASPRLARRAAKEVEPVEQVAFGRFLPDWHGIDRRATLREALVPLKGRAARRALGVGCPAAARPRLPPGLARPALRDRRARLGPAPGSTGSPSFSERTRPCSAARGSRASRRRGARRGSRSPGRAPSSGSTSLDSTGLEPEAALPALWDLVWAGEVTNDAWTPLRAGRRYGVPKPARRPRRFSRRRRNRDPATQGRWSLAGRLFAGRPTERALAELLLERQGIVTRDGVRAEGIPGGYAAVYGELQALETLGLCRRGYFVEGLGGAQFAVRGAVERLRELRPREDEAA